MIRRAASAVAMFLTSLIFSIDAVPSRGLAATADGARPNILLIVADDAGYADIGSFGGEMLLCATAQPSESHCQLRHYFPSINLPVLLVISGLSSNSEELIYLI